MSNNSELIITTLIHATLLFVILSVFFTKIISNTARKNIEKEVNELINKNLEPITQQSNLVHVNKYINKDKLIYLFSKEDYTSATNNKYIFGILKFLSIMLLINLVITYIVLKFILKCDVSIIPLLTVNIITLLFVGIIELAFFLKIARHYIPVQPSLITKTFLKSIKKNISNVPSKIINKDILNTENIIQAFNMSETNSLMGGLNSNPVQIPANKPVVQIPANKPTVQNNIQIPANKPVVKNSLVVQQINTVKN